MRAVQRADQVLRVGRSRAGAGLRRAWPPVTTRGCRRAGCAAPSITTRTSPTCSAVLTAEQLRHALFPIGDTPKPQIRAEAARRGLAVAEKPDSHDICFIPSGDTRAFLGARIGVRRGTVVDGAGAVLAEHDGVHGFTIGQRKGLGIAGPGPDGRPRYVTAIDARHRHGAGRRRSRTSRCGRSTGIDPVFTSGTAPGRSGRVRGAGARTRRHRRRGRRGARRHGWSSSCALHCAGWRRGRRWCSTGPIPTATKCSAAPRSGPPGSEPRRSPETGAPLVQ